MSWVSLLLVYFPGVQHLLDSLFYMLCWWDPWNWWQCNITHFE